MQFKQVDYRYSEKQIDNEKTVYTLYQMTQAAMKLNQEIHSVEMTPKFILPFIQNGRLIHVKEGKNDFGWGVIVGYSKNKDAKEGAIETKYIIDVLIRCSERSTLNALIPCETGKVAKLQVTQIFMNCIEDLSSIRVFMPKDLRPAANRTTVENSINEVLRRYNNKVPCLDPFKDLKVSWN